MKRLTRDAAIYSGMFLFLLVTMISKSSGEQLCPDKWCGKPPGTASTAGPRKPVSPGQDASNTSHQPANNATPQTQTKQVGKHNITVLAPAQPTRYQCPQGQICGGAGFN